LELCESKAERNEITDREGAQISTHFSYLFWPLLPYFLVAYLFFSFLSHFSREHPSEPHYLYALGRLEAQKWVPEGDDNHHRFSRTLMEKQQDADVKLRASLDARQKPPAFYGDKVGLWICYVF